MNMNLVHHDTDTEHPIASCLGTIVGNMLAHYIVFPAILLPIYNAVAVDFNLPVIGYGRMIAVCIGIRFVGTLFCNHDPITK